MAIKKKKELPGNSRKTAPKAIARSTVSKKRIPAAHRPGLDSINCGFTDALHLNLCLRCSMDLLTKRLGLSPSAAFQRMKKFMPSAADIASQAINPPHFFSGAENSRCPHCEATERLQARMRILRWETMPEEEAHRRTLLKQLRGRANTLAILDDKRSLHDLFFARLGLWQRQINFDEKGWVLQAALDYLKRMEPGVEWKNVCPDGPKRVALFYDLEGQWKVAGRTLGLSRLLYGDILVVQYLLSRSHTSGGFTLAGRLTVYDLIYTLRRIGYLRARAIEDADPYVILEKVVEALAQDRKVKVTYLIERKHYLQQIQAASLKRKLTAP